MSKENPDRQLKIGTSHRHLESVPAGFNAETGEVLDHCPGCIERDATIAALETEKRGWRVRYQNLKRGKDAEARNHDLFPKAKALFDYWREKCNHPNSPFTPDRFFEVLPFLTDYGEDLCRRAIDGAAFDPYVTTRKNQTQKRHDGWKLIHRDADKFEEFCNRAPQPKEE